MIKRIIDVSTPGTYLHVDKRNLKVCQSGIETGSIPLEDICLLIIDSFGVTVSSSALAEASENGIAVLVCGKNHHPCGTLLPIAGNQLHTQKLADQVKAPLPVLKRSWQEVVQAKIRNQASVLEEGPAKVRLNALALTVRSGDPENVEGQAARLYFSALFGNDFVRDRDSGVPNSLLNYGYMVLRAAVARAVCLAGLHPAIGIHHHHRNNPFCLADDLMEPYRPFVDLIVRDLERAGANEINREVKTALLSVLSADVITSQGLGPLQVAIHRTASSMASRFADRESPLVLPKFPGNAR